MVARAWSWLRPDWNHVWEPITLGRKGRTVVGDIVILHGERRTEICTRCGHTRPFAEFWCKPPFSRIQRLGER